MKLLLLGTNGKLGRLLIEEAIRRKHIVHILLEEKDRLSFSSERIIPFAGSPLEKEALAHAIKGCQGIMSTLTTSRSAPFSLTPLSPSRDFLSRSMENIIDLAEQNLIERVLVSSSWGVGDSRREIPFWYYWLLKFSNLYFPYREQEYQEDLLKASQLKWTSVRLVSLKKSSQEKVVLISQQGHPRPNFRIGRRNVARFMLDIMEQERFVCQTPTIYE